MRILGALALVAAGAACGPHRPGTAAAWPAGSPSCYTLRVEGWESPRVRRFRPPDVVRLDTALVRIGDAADGAWRALAPDIPAMAVLAGPARDRPPVWRRGAADSLHLTWATGYERTSVAVAMRGDS